jgi:hypothetical protein
VDSVHKSAWRWIIENYGQSPNRIYYADSAELYEGNVVELDEKAPFNFIAYFNENQEITNTDWVYIRLYLKALLFDGKPPRMTRRMTNLLFDELHTELKECTPIVEEKFQAENCYSFQKSIFEDRNMALCEIIKPIVVTIKDKKSETEVVEHSVPYTVVIRNFATRGFYPLFWSLFICESWGKVMADILFLKALWSDLKMDGEFNMDKIMEDGMADSSWSTGVGASAGPEVYRKTLKETLENLMMKEQGLPRSNKFIPI